MFIKHMILFLVDVTRRSLNRITRDSKDFLAGKGVYHLEDGHSYTRLFGFEGSPFLLSKFVIDRMLIIEVYR